jgi:hypothetical protein
VGVTTPTLEPREASRLQARRHKSYTRLTLLNNTAGGLNAATGASALGFNTFGSYNVATGYRALGMNTTGQDNSATGTEALLLNTTGNSNTATGRVALLFQHHGKQLCPASSGHYGPFHQGALSARLIFRRYDRWTGPQLGAPPALPQKSGHALLSPRDDDAHRTADYNRAPAAGGR